MNYMPIDKIQELLNEGMSGRQIAKNLGKSNTSIRYWIKKYQIKPDTQKLEQCTSARTHAKCSKCATLKPTSDFYKYKKSSRLSSYCKVCSRNQVVQRQNALKLKCLEYKGGKCINCGYSNCIAALEFHHTDPTKKILV